MGHKTTINRHAASNAVKNTRPKTVKKLPKKTKPAATAVIATRPTIAFSFGTSTC